MSGLIESIEPSSAWAPPMRPPFWRFSRVSSAPKTWVRADIDSAIATTSSADAPFLAASAAAITIEPRPTVIDVESTTRMSASIESAAVIADCIVADRAALMLMHTMAVAPASR